MYLVIILVIAFVIMLYYLYLNRKISVRTNRDLAEKFYREAEGDSESVAIVKSITYWINTIMEDYDTTALLNLADIYNYYDIVSPELFTPFNYDIIDGLSKSKSVAYSLYGVIADSTHDSELLVTVREKRDDLEQFAKSNIFKQPIRKYNNPENFGGRYNTLTDTQLMNYVTTATTEAEQFGFINADDFTDAVNIAIAIEREVEPVVGVTPTVTPTVTPIVTPIAIVGGSQNVHDSSVVRSITNCLKQLSGSIDYLIDSSTTVRQIREYIEDNKDNLQTDLSTDKLNNAIRTLDVCERNTVPLSNGYTDTNALQYVWSRINSKCNAERVGCLKDNLVSALADCVENSTVVCATGRVTHIVSALEMADISSDPVQQSEQVDLSIKPEWVVKVEIRNKIGKLYNDYINELPTDSLTLYNSNSELPDDIKAVDTINSTIKARITADIQKEYTELVSPDKLNIILENDLKAI